MTAMTGEKKNLTENFDGWVGTYTWASGFVRVLFCFGETGRVANLRARFQGPTLACSCRAASAPPAQRIVTFGSCLAGSNDDLALTNDGKTLLYTRMSVSTPNEIYRYVCLAARARAGFPRVSL